jgi:hypothetical protein
MSPAEYAVHEKQDGENFDYSEFDQLIDPRPIPRYVRILKRAINSPRVDKVTILTALRKSGAGCTISTVSGYYVWGKNCSVRRFRSNKKTENISNDKLITGLLVLPSPTTVQKTLRPHVHFDNEIRRQSWWSIRWSLNHQKHNGAANNHRSRRRNGP